MQVEQWLPVVSGMVAGAVTGWITVQVRLTKLETLIDERAKARELERREQQYKETGIDHRMRELGQRYHDLREVVLKYQHTAEGLIGKFLDHVSRRGG